MQFAVRLFAHPPSFNCFAKAHRSDASNRDYLSPSICDSTSVKKLENTVANINPAGVQAGGNRNDPLVVAEWEDIQMTIAAERAALPGWRKFVYRGMWKRTVAGFTVQVRRCPDHHRDCRSSR